MCLYNLYKQKIRVNQTATYIVKTKCYRKSTASWKAKTRTWVLRSKTTNSCVRFSGRWNSSHWFATKPKNRIKIKAFAPTGQKPFYIHLLMREQPLTHVVAIPAFLHTFIDNIWYVVIYADGFMPYFSRANRLTSIDASIGCIGVFCRHLPERIFDNNRCVIADA